MEAGVGILLAIVALLVCLLITIFGFLIYSGLFVSVDIGAGRPPFENITVAYKFARGPYKNAGALFTEVNNYAPSLRSIGLYYDDPNEVASSKLRYVVGAIVNEGGDDDGSNMQYANLLMEKGYRLAKLPKVNHAVTTTFPFRNTLSIFLAVARTYPLLSEYIKERKLCAHPMIEIYDNDVIHFVAPLAKQGEFYVPEATEELDDRSDIQETVRVRKGSSTGSDTVAKAGARAEDSAARSETEAKAVEPNVEETKDDISSKDASQKKDGSGGSGGDSTGSSFEELNVEADK